jgi:hypothetical protein
LAKLILEMALPDARLEEFLISLRAFERTDPAGIDVNLRVDARQLDAETVQGMVERMMPGSEVVVLHDLPQNSPPGGRAAERLREFHRQHDSAISSGQPSEDIPPDI